VKGHASGAARRYARALVDLAVAEGTAEAVRAGLRSATRLLAEQLELRLLLAHPAVSVENKRAVVERIWADAPLLVRRLILLLASGNRASLLPEIERLYSHEWNARRGVVEAEALSVQPLSAAQRQALAGALGRLSGREVELTTALAPEILGGLLVRMDGRVYDGSVRGRLRALRRRLAGQAQGA
jgi:F-type H+-transporting ATPase subunit delta